MIQPHYSTLELLFNNRVFRIPKYQRFYSWQKKQRDDLFNDLKALKDRGGDEHHFMATIVCHSMNETKSVGSKQYKLFEIVDGQQRLTTLIIICKCIHLALQDDDEKRDLGKLLIKDDNNLILLQTNNANEHIFNNFLRNGKKPAKSDLKTHADRNMHDAMLQCTRFVENWNDDHGDILSLLSLIKNRLGLIVYDTESNKVVYTIFEVLNSRGLDVDWLDKSKCILMGKAYELSENDQAAESLVHSLHSQWGNIYGEIADCIVPGQEILRVTATLYHGDDAGKPKSAENALTTLKQFCTDSHKPQEITDRLFEITKKLVQIQKNVFLGPATNILHARMLATAIMLADSLNETEIKNALEQWERVTFRIYGLYGKDSRSKVGDYTRLAYKIINESSGASRYSEIMESLRNLGKDYSIDGAVKEGLSNKNCYEGRQDVCRYLLWQYEESLAKQNGIDSTSYENIRQEIWRVRSASESIEHVFPQNPELGSAWDGKMENTVGPQPVEENVHRIGNLILLPAALNNEASRKPFSIKKQTYQKYNLCIIKQITEKKDWNLSEIEKREEQIIKWAKERWKDMAD